MDVAEFALHHGKFVAPIFAGRVDHDGVAIADQAGRSAGMPQKAMGGLVVSRHVHETKSDR